LLIADLDDRRQTTDDGFEKIDLKVGFLYFRNALYENAVKKFYRSRARKQKRCLSQNNLKLQNLRRASSFLLRVGIKF
jgi:hypothetical protein